MPKAKAKAGSTLIERNPVLLSMKLLKDMGIEQPMHTKFAPLWGPLWVALIEYRDTLKPEQWNADLYDALLSSQADYDTGEAWDKLNTLLNEIWEKANG